MNKLEYFDYHEDGIFGRFTFEDESEPFCYTLSHAFKQEDGSYQPIVQPGIYTCVRGQHQLDHGGPFETFEITGVDGHSGLLFHQGNWNRDSNGCTLVGKEMIESSLGRMLTMSVFTFRSFMEHLEGVDSFILEVKDVRVH